MNDRLDIRQLHHLPDPYDPWLWEMETEARLKLLDEGRFVPASIRESHLLAFGPRLPEQFALPHLGTPLRFVIKRHRATTLHTDLRLEAFGELLSWVFWRHPSLDPRTTLPAKEMPDHDPRYMQSERRIPDGRIGAGPMIVWDHGWYAPLVAQPMSPSRSVVTALQRGRLDFWIEGVRLKGGFRLQKVAKDWRFSKLDDDHATTSPIIWDDLSVLSGRSLDDIEAEFLHGRT